MEVLDLKKNENKLGSIKLKKKEVIENEKEKEKTKHMCCSYY